MKRLLIVVVVIALAACLCPQPVRAFEAVSSAGLGWIMQKAAHSEMGYYVGFGAPVVEKKESGYLLKNETGYIYSGFSDNVKAIRTYAVNCKSLVTRPDWGLYVGLAGGIWQFITESEASGKAELLGAVMGQFGFRWGFAEFQLSGEVIQREGADLFFPSLGLSLSF
jgi:hypothetical protein